MRHSRLCSLCDRCYPLTLSGSKIRTPNVDGFICLWISFCTWPSVLERRCLPTVPIYSMSQGMPFSDVAPFLQANPELSPVTDQNSRCSRIENPTVQIELAAVVDAGGPFVKATCNLEGDSSLVRNLELSRLSYK